MSSLTVTPAVTSPSSTPTVRLSEFSSLTQAYNIITRLLPFAQRHTQSRLFTPHQVLICLAQHEALSPIAPYLKGNTRTLASPQKDLVKTPFRHLGIDYTEVLPIKHSHVPYVYLLLLIYTTTHAERHAL